jgi:hypothetical protein
MEREPEEQEPVPEDETQASPVRSGSEPRVIPRASPEGRSEEGLDSEPRRLPLKAG